MAEERVQRRLAAILAADVAGYSRLMGDDEEGTLAALKRCRSEVIDPRIAEHKGRIVKTTGDGVLIEFPSVLEAMRCAVAVQREMSTRNADVPAETRMSFRVGINLGDVMLDEDDIFGDGVNIAARLEGLAEPDGIAISGSVFEQVHNRLDVGYQDLGEQTVKNIAQSVRVYRVLLDADPGESTVPSAKRKWTLSRKSITAVALALLAIAGAIAWLVFLGSPDLVRKTATLENMAYPLPDEPSIAVLPFDNRSSDPGQSYLGDGLTENIISSLSKIPRIFVIARNSAFTYKDKAVKVRQVAEELGVRFVLTGSIQRSGDKLRITTQLIDSLSGRHLWSERYDRQVKDIFALQDEITLNVVEGLQVQLTEGEMVHVRRQGTNNLEAFLLVTQSLEIFQRFTKEDNARARELAEKAITLDPSYTDAYIRLARTHLIDYQAGWAANRAASFKRTVELVKQALTLDNDYPDAYNVLGAIYLFIRRHDEAIAYAEKAVSLSPSLAIAKASLGMNQTYAGEPEKAIATLQSAMRLSPYYPFWFLKELGRAYFQSGKYDDAIESLNQHLRRDPQGGEARILLAAAYAAAGQEEDARAAIEVFLRTRPSYTLKHYAQGEFYRNPDDLKQVLDALRTAGMPE